jgi:hypothetical protein
MTALLERLSAGELIEILSILVGGIVVLVFILSITKYQLQSLADETTLKREKQEAELTLRAKIVEQAAERGISFETLLAANDAEQIPNFTPPKSPKAQDELDVELAKGIGMLEIATEDIEETLPRALVLDPDRKKAVVEVIEELVESGANHQSILATVRSLCVSASPKVRASDIPIVVPVA